MKNGKIEEFKDYIHSIFNYEKKLDQLIKPTKEIEGKGYLVFTDDFVDFKNKLNYKNCKKYYSLKEDNELESLFDLNNFNQVKRIEPIEIKSVNFIKNIIININCVLITEELFKIIDSNKIGTIEFKAQNKNLTLFLNNNEQLKLTHNKFILDTSSFEKNDPCKEEIKNIFDSIENYYKFENNFIKDIKEKMSKTAYGFLVSKSWFDEWKNYSNYENLKNYFSDNFISYEKKKEIYYKIINYREENKYIILSKTEALKPNNENELNNILQEESLVIIDKNFNNSLKILKNQYDSINYNIGYNAIKIIFRNNKNLSLKCENNIIPIKKGIGEEDDLNDDLKQLIRIFYFQYSLPDDESKEYNYENIQRNKIFLINKTRIQKYIQKREMILIIIF